MILYSIRNKGTGNYFVHFNGNLKPQWCFTPTFSHKPDTIWKNLARLCSDGFWESYTIPCSGVHKYYRKNWKNFRASRLKRYEVVTFNVKVLGTKCVDAKDFVIPKKLAKMNVRIK